jgi:hypothetical protein
MAWKRTTLFLPFIPNALGGNGPLPIQCKVLVGHLKTGILSGDGNIRRVHATECLGVKLFLCLIKHDIMKTYGGGEVEFHAYLTFALDRGDCPL